MNFQTSDFAKIIGHLNPNKPNDYDMVSIPIIKLSGYSIWEQLSLIFINCLNDGKFPSE